MANFSMKQKSSQILKTFMPFCLAFRVDFEYYITLS